MMFKKASKLRKYSKHRLNLEKKSQKQTPQEETHQEITLEEPKKE